MARPRRTTVLTVLAVCLFIGSLTACRNKSDQAPSSPAGSSTSAAAGTVQEPGGTTLANSPNPCELVTVDEIQALLGINLPDYPPNSGGGQVDGTHIASPYGNKGVRPGASRLCSRVDMTNQSDQQVQITTVVYPSAEDARGDLATELEARKDYSQGPVAEVSGIGDAGFTMINDGTGVIMFARGNLEVQIVIVHIPAQDLKQVLLKFGQQASARL